MQYSRHENRVTDLRIIFSCDFSISNNSFTTYKSLERINTERKFVRKRWVFHSYNHILMIWRTDEKLAENRQWTDGALGGWSCLLGWWQRWRKKGWNRLSEQSKMLRYCGTTRPSLWIMRTLLLLLLMLPLYWWWRWWRWCFWYEAAI